MTLNLSPSWELTTEKPTSSYGQPVLVNLTTGEAFYEPGDLVLLCPSRGFEPAAAAVSQLAKTAKLSAEGRAMVEAFAV